MSFPILLFAAGLGTRMGHLTKDKPKALIEVAGQSLLDHALALAEDAPVGPIVVNLHYKAEMIRTHVEGRNLAFSDETDLLRETGGGLRHALPLLGDGPVMTMNTDAVWDGPNPLHLIAQHWKDGMEALLLTVPRTQFLGHKGQGDFVTDSKGRLQRGPGVVYAGLQIMRTESLHDIGDDVFSLNKVWDQMISRGGVYGVNYPGKICDVGNPDSIPLAEALLDV